MAVSRFSNSTIANGFPKYQRFWDQSSVIVLGAYESIATAIVSGSSTTDVNFTSIPSTYKHLQIRGVVRTSRTAGAYGECYMRFNGDTGTNYSFHRSLSIGGSITGGAETNQDHMSYVWQVTDYSPSGIYAPFVIDILDYANTNKNKTVRGITGFDTNTADYVLNYTGSVWRSNSAINSINMRVTSGPFVQYSKFALYGIKGS